MTYTPVLVTAPATEPITIAEARNHLRLDAAYGEPAPAAPTAALISPAAAGNVNDGDHRYRVTFVTADGETEGGEVTAAVTVADKTVNGKVSLTAIPLGGSAVTSRKVYRTVAGGSTYLLLTTLADNTTTVYTDNTADSGLGAGAPTTNTTVDPEVMRMMRSARRRVEAATGRQLITATYDYTLPSFPGCGHIELPTPPLQSVTSITYYDTADAGTVFAASNYRVITSSVRGQVALNYATYWPLTTLRPSEGVVVRYVAGYGAAGAVPEDLKAAILLLLGHEYANREAVTGTGGITVGPQVVPMGVAALLANYDARRR